MRKGSSSGEDEKEVSDSKDEEEGLYMTMRESSHIPTEVEERVKEENGGKVKKSKKRTTRASTHAMILGMDADEEEGHRGSFGSKKKKIQHCLLPTEGIIRITTHGSIIITTAIRITCPSYLPLSNTSPHLSLSP